MKSHALCFALLSVAAAVASPPAQAAGTLTRTFVSSAGHDTNPCTIALPCATFAAAYNAVVADGIVAALDPGHYGPLTITGPVTINGNGFAAITGMAQGSGITINAVSGNVTLNGLEIDGAGAAYNGIVFNSGNSLAVSNCIVKDFVENFSDQLEATGNGIWIAPTSGTINFTIINTIAVNNQFAGINYGPPSGSATAAGAIDHVVANNNGLGIIAELLGNANGSAVISISNSVASNNTGSGIDVLGAPFTVTIDHDQLNNNLYGVFVNPGTVLLGRSVITENSAYGISNAGTVETFQNNHINANANNNAVNGIALASVSTQ
jgi:hypothetical protein